MLQVINLSPNTEEWELPAPIDFTAGPPRWLGESYPGIEKDIARDVFSAIFWDMTQRQAKDGQPYDLQDQVVKARLMSEAILKAAERSQTLQEDVHRSVYELIYLAKKTGAWQMGLYEYASIEEWLKNKLPNFERGQMYDIKFLLEQLFPLLESLGDNYHPENLLKFQEEWSKTRASIPYMRTLYNEYMSALKENEAKGDSIVDDNALKTFTEGIQNTLNVIADPEVKAWSGDKTIATELRGLRQPKKKMWNGHMGSVKQRTIYVFSVPNYLDRAVENALKNIANFKGTDPQLLSNDVLDMIDEAMQEK